MLRRLRNVSSIRFDTSKAMKATEHHGVPTMPRPRGREVSISQRPNRLSFTPAPDHACLPQLAARLAPRRQGDARAGFPTRDTLVFRQLRPAGLHERLSFAARAQLQIVSSGGQRHATCAATPNFAAIPVIRRQVKPAGCRSACYWCDFVRAETGRPK